MLDYRMLTRVPAAAAGLLMAALWWGDARADGWHDPVLDLGSVNDWLRDVKATIPDLDEQLSSASLRSGRGIEDLKKLAQDNAGKPKSSSTKRGPVRGGNLQANLTPQQQALLARKANDCLQVLAFMKQGNIYPHEFPNFPIDKIPEYRQTARQLLNLMGSAGSSAVVGQLRTHLMSGFPAQFDVSYHPAYAAELLDVLATSAASGALSPQDLESLHQAMQGVKPPDVQAFVNQIDKTLGESLAIKSLLAWASAAADPKRKAELLVHLRNRLSQATAGELEAALNDEGLDTKTRGAVAGHLRKFLPELGIAGLLKLLLVEHPSLHEAAERELRARKPTYSAVKDEIPEIREHAQAPNQRVAAYANYFLAKAFQEAPIAHCLHWLGKQDSALNAVVWKQLDARIAAADDATKTAYANTTLKAIQLADVDQPTKQACLELLGRLKSRDSVKPIVDLAPQLPRELWPMVGTTLRQISGQDYGPKPGAGVAELTVALKKWRDWLQQNGQ